jgi:hypothetical protein
LTLKNLSAIEASTAMTCPNLTAPWWMTTNITPLKLKILDALNPRALDIRKRIDLIR